MSKLIAGIILFVYLDCHFLLFLVAELSLSAANLIQTMATEFDHDTNSSAAGGRRASMRRLSRRRCSDGNPGTTGAAASQRSSASRRPSAIVRAGRWLMSGAFGGSAGLLPASALRRSSGALSSASAGSRGGSEAAKRAASIRLRQGLGTSGIWAMVRNAGSRGDGSGCEQDNEVISQYRVLCSLQLEAVRLHVEYSCRIKLAALLLPHVQFTGA